MFFNFFSPGSNLFSGCYNEELLLNKEILKKYGKIYRIMIKYYLIMSLNPENGVVL